MQWMNLGVDGSIFSDTNHRPASDVFLPTLSRCWSISSLLGRPAEDFCFNFVLLDTPRRRVIIDATQLDITRVGKKKRDMKAQRREKKNEKKGKGKGNRNTRDLYSILPIPSFSKT